MLLVAHALLLSWLLGAGASAEGWYAGLLRGLLEDCPLGTLGGCASHRAWRALDRIIEADVVPLIDGLELVRLGPRAHVTHRQINDSIAFHLRKSPERLEEDEDGQGWREKLTSRLGRMLRSHVVRIDVDRLAGRSVDAARTTARGRKRRKHQMQMMPIVMMGVLLMGSVLIPMGFQFLAVLGGKALILAKMALMLSSIQGLKKIATNGVNYGLYHTSVPEPWHERSSYVELPYVDGHHGPAPPPVPPYFGPAPFAGRP